jgi:hypothetical protein
LRTLALVSPMMRGKDVETAQRKLVSGKFLRSVDGVYGPESARASSQAHWELGFAGKLAQSNHYGDTLDKVLSRWLADGSLPKDYGARRVSRLKSPGSSVGERSLAWLRKHVGDTEQPAGSNRVEWASIWYGIVGPWCAMGVTRARVEAGSKVFKRGQFYAYVPYIVADAVHAQHGLRRTFQPRPGDLCCFDWPGASPGIFDHIETVDVPPGALTGGTPFSTIGCNTSFDDGGSQSNGGACAARHRTILGGGRTVFVHEVGL